MEQLQINNYQKMENSIIILTCINFILVCFTYIASRRAINNQSAKITDFTNQMKEALIVQSNRIELKLKVQREHMGKRIAAAHTKIAAINPKHQKGKKYTYKTKKLER